MGTKQKVIQNENSLLFIEEQKGDNEYKLSPDWRRIPYLDLIGRRCPYRFDFFNNDSNRNEIRWLIKRCYFWGS